MNEFLRFKVLCIVGDLLVRSILSSASVISELHFLVIECWRGVRIRPNGANFEV